LVLNETTEGFEILELPTYQTSIKEFGEKHKVDYPTAQGVIKYLVAKGLAHACGTRKAAGSGKGKPTNVYDVPKEVQLKLVA
jgi:hypothetical protein